MGLNGSPKRLKLRKTLHLADTIGGGKRIQENPPPGTNVKTLRLMRLSNSSRFIRILSAGVTMPETMPVAKF